MGPNADPGARPIGLMGVTGTSGKTTTCHLLEAILQDGCPPGALCSSEAQRIGQRHVTISQPRTEPVELGQFLREAAEAGAPWAVVELESAELGPVIDIAVVTNTTEHDRQAVAKLFHALSPERQAGRPRAAVLNRDEPDVMQLAEGRHVPVLTFGLHPEADVRATEVEVSLEGSKFLLHLPGAQPEPCHLQLLGEQNVRNALAAAAGGHLLGLSAATIARALFRCPGLPGRMERIEEGQRFHVVVDYADTPDRLAQLARFRPPGADRVSLLGYEAFRPAVAEARHGDLLILTGRPAPGFAVRDVIREVLGSSHL
ncbi:MAG TPA: Mur ligase family protein [Symbiobacteriaceae bacterium]|nr:Mur ligase family protein [Symbiobacteriaceae bacterium]